MIKASLDSLRFLQDRIDPEVGQRLENIRSAALRLSDLATTLITRDRLVEQALSPQKSQVEMGKLVGDLLLAHPATEALEIHVPAAPVILGVDPALIRVALYNLIDNAITHHGAAQGKVRIDLEATRTGAEIRVSDRGQGIPDAVKERVFHRHFSSSGEIAKGIGLASVRAIARSHGGDVSVRDNQPNGAVLVMTLLG